MQSHMPSNRTVTAQLYRFPDRSSSIELEMRCEDVGSRLDAVCFGLSR